MAKMLKIRKKDYNRLARYIDTYSPSIHRRLHNAFQDLDPLPLPSPKEVADWGAKFESLARTEVNDGASARDRARQAGAHDGYNPAEVIARAQIMADENVVWLKAAAAHDRDYGVPSPEFRPVPECLNCDHQGAQRGIDGDGQEAWLCDCCFAVRGSIEVDDIEWVSAPWSEDERATRAGWDASEAVHLTDEAGAEPSLTPNVEPPEEPEAETDLDDEYFVPPPSQPRALIATVPIFSAAPSAPSASEALAAAAAISTVRPEGFEPCPLCDRATFTNAKQRGDHIRNHNLDSLTCPKCESRVQRWDMGNHLANCSPGVPAEAEPVPQDTNPGPPATDHTSPLMGVSPANPWTCPDCGTVRSNASSRDVHIKRCPGGTCQWCGLGYVDLGTHRPVCAKKPRGGENCVHRWVLGRPQGEIVHARCDFCHATKEMSADRAPIGRGR